MSETYLAMFGGFAIEFPRERLETVPRMGRADEAVDALARDPAIQAAFEDISANRLRAELRAYGAWDDEELSDDAENRKRIVWIAACNMREEDAKGPQCRFVGGQT